MFLNWLADRLGTLPRKRTSRGASEQVVSRCPECKQAQRHPNKAGRVSCPCGVLYDWPSGRTVLEIITVAFVCAKTDKPFTIVQERLNRRRPFRHRSVECDPKESLDRRLDREVQRDFIVDAVQGKSISVDDFDSNGSVCPHCQPAGNATGWSYISCVSCGANVCSGTVSTSRDNRVTFTCRSSCGSEGDLLPSSDAISVTEMNIARRLITHTGLSRRGHDIQVAR